MATRTKKVIEADVRMERMVRMCKSASMPRDQIDRFVKSGIVILPRMMAFHAASREADKEGGPDEIAMGGSRGPGKSFTSMAQVGIDDCQRVPGLKVLFLRKVMKSAAESLDDLTRKVFQFIPHSSTADGVEFPNGSRILIGGYKDVRDIDKYLGIEYDVIVIEEATQLTEDKKDKIRGSLRTTKANWRARMYLTTNADGIGLAWFKKTYVLPQREKREQWTRFFDVSYKDNPFLKADYIRWLEGLKGSLGKAWRDADWDAFAGMAFPMWNYERHVMDPFEIPESWFKWRAVDEGTANPFCCLWAARDPASGRIYVYREAYQAELTSTRQADLINEMTLPNEKIAFTFADPAMWARKNMGNQVYTSFDQYKDRGVYLTRADNDRLSGKRKVDDVLSDLPDGEPGMVIFSNVVYLIEQLSTLARDNLNPEDVDTQQEDHAYDTARYLLTNHRRTSPQARTPAQQELLKQSNRNPFARVKGI